MLEAVELPAGVARLDTGLTEVDGDDLTHFIWIELSEILRGGRRAASVREGDESAHGATDAKGRGRRHQEGA
eukprot:CAMPEP_0174700364 /NCGR_PEP_ID=MMETSP1094-20130205/5334_1 /TAXON_ID=156173 /ORGANISM="Chrysochromulina brevifilum, Strain UTEX LB 985" /LENGTH=71 /DNA_ID=CAMNT_0015897829 /DNA_START=1 /DNA_END=212 /DNA_ORIENTATION=-